MFQFTDSARIWALSRGVLPPLPRDGRVTEHHLGPSACHNPLIIKAAGTRLAWSADDDLALDG